MSGFVDLPFIRLERLRLDSPYEEIRYPYLDLSGDKPMLVATNGHWMIAAPRRCRRLGRTGLGQSQGYSGRPSSERTIVLRRCWDVRIKGSCDVRAATS